MALHAPGGAGPRDRDALVALVAVAANGLAILGRPAAALVDARLAVAGLAGGGSGHVVVCGVVQRPDSLNRSGQRVPFGGGVQQVGQDAGENAFSGAVSARDRIGALVVPGRVRALLAVGGSRAVAATCRLHHYVVALAQQGA